MSICPFVARHLAEQARVDQQHAELYDPTTTRDRQLAILMQWQRDIAELDAEIERIEALGERPLA